MKQTITCLPVDSGTAKRKTIYSLITSGVTGGGGGRVPPETSDREIFADV